MTDRDPTTSRPVSLAADAANDDDRGRSLSEALQFWHASLDQEQAYFERGELADPRLDMTDITGAVEAAALEVALAPARTLEELTLKAEVADYLLGGIEAVEEALAKEKKGEGRLQQLMTLGLLRDLLRLPSGERRSES